MARAQRLLRFGLFAAALVTVGTWMPLARADAPTLEELAAAVQQNPGSVQAWDRYGQALARASRFTEAQKAYTQALRLDPNAKHVLHHAAVALAWSGDYAEAERRYAELLSRYPNDIRVRLDYGQTLAWDKRFAPARTQYERVLAADPRHVEALRLLGLLTAWEGNYPDALELIERGLLLAPKDVDLLVNKGEVRAWQGKLAAAELAFQQARALAPKNASVLVKLAQVHLWQHRARDAQETYLQAIALDAANIDAYLGLSDAYAANQKYTEAENLLRAAAALFPGNPHLSQKLSALAAQRTLGLVKLVELLEPPFFVLILLVVFRHVWRYRRTLHHHHRVAQVLFMLLPAIALLTLLIYAFVLTGGAYRREAEVATRLLEFLSLTALVAVFFALVWLMRFRRAQANRVVLVVAAHPDDIEFGCGATILRYREQGYATYGLVLSKGEKGMPDTQNPGARVDEAKASARVIALNEVTVLDFPDARLHACKDAIKRAIEEAIDRLAPDIVFTHTPDDLHTDHQVVFEATREAARGSVTILCYENPNTPPGFAPNYFVDVTDYIDDKIAAVARHKSQSGKRYTDPEVIRSNAGFRGAQARVKYAEAFVALRVLEKQIAS